jgi:hypothetical protein
MTKLLLVSRNPGIAIGLRGQFDVLEHRPKPGWHIDPDALTDVDAVVLELHDVELSRDVVAAISAAGFSGPTIVITAKESDLAGVSGEGHVVAVEFPVTGASLTAVLHEHLPGRRADSKHGRRREPERAPRPPTDAMPAATPSRAISLASRTLPSPRRAARPATEIERTPQRLPALRRDRSDPYELVRDLLGESTHLHGLRDVASDLLGDAIAATQADAGVVLVPDGSYWRVAAGVGIRHVEWRLALDRDAWIVNEVALTGHGIVVEGSDIVRQRLSGVPLASWDHLMSAPLPQSQVMMIVARREPPFAKSDLELLVKAAQLRRAALDDAFALRDLARALHPFADEENLD